MRHARSVGFSRGIVLGFLAGLIIASCTRLAFGQDGQAGRGLTREQALEMIRNAPPGSTIDFEQVDQQAQGVGAGFRGDGSQIKGEFNASAPAAGLDGLGTAKGSGVDSSFTLKGADNPLIRIVVGVLGALIMLAGGGGGIYLQNRRLAIGGFAVGGLLVAVAIYPPAFLWGILAALVLGAGLLIKAEFEAKRKHESLIEVLSGTYAQGGGAVQGLFNSLAGSQGSTPSVLSHIQDVIAKERLGVPSAPVVPIPMTSGFLTGLQTGPAQAVRAVATPPVI
jgi:hypothetical protein